MHHDSQESSSFHLCIKSELVLRPPPDRLLLRRNCLSPWHEASSIQVTYMCRVQLSLTVSSSWNPSVMQFSLHQSVFSFQSGHSILLLHPCLFLCSVARLQVSKLWPESMATKISSVVFWEASSDVALANRRATMVKISLFHFRSSISWYFRFWPFGTYEFATFDVKSWTPSIFSSIIPYILKEEHWS